MSVRDVADIRVVRDAADLSVCAGGAFVPTMGALHDGHTSLIRRARELGRPVVVSLFVNPTQFGPGEDFEQYPRAFEADLHVTAAAGGEVVFAPSADLIYPPDASATVPTLPPAATRPGLEDTHRPGHFAGVCQVVARLFDLVRPAVAVFGEKDYQQLLVIRQLVEQAGDRWPGLVIDGQPTVREPDGLALSSRNRYLSPDERAHALGLVEALRAAPHGEAAMHAVLDRHGLDVDYAVVRDAATLEDVSPDRPARALVAARVGKVRLIDNMKLE